MTDSIYLGMTKVSTGVIHYIIIFGRLKLLSDTYNLYKHDIEVRSLNICLYQLTCICLSADLCAHLHMVHIVVYMCFYAHLCAACVWWHLRA